MRGSSVPILIALAALFTLVVRGTIREPKADSAPSRMTARISSKMHTTGKALTEGKDYISFVLYDQVPTTLPASVLFVLHSLHTPSLRPAFPNPTTSTTSPVPTFAPTTSNPTIYTIAPTLTSNLRQEPKANGTWSLNIESGNKGVHIGSWTLDETYYGIRNALRKRCGDPVAPDKKPRKKSKPAPPKKWGKETCSPKDSGFDNEYATKKGEQTLEQNAAIVKIASSDIPEAYGTNLQNVFIEQIVDLLRLAVKDDKNCYGFDTKSTVCFMCLDAMCISKMGNNKNRKVDAKTRIRRWCNVPDYVRVGLADPYGREVAHMRVEVRFACPEEKVLASPGCIKEMGRFDCMAVVGAVGGESRANGTRSAMLKAATHGKGVDVVAACPNKEVTGTCPNAECVYKLGACFGKLFG